MESSTGPSRAGWGALALDCERRAPGLLTALVNEDRREAIDGEPTASQEDLTGELVIGGVFSVIRTRMLERRGRPLVELAPSLMSFIATAHRGQAGACSDLAGVPASAGGAPSQAGAPPVRTTYRTARVLQAISSAPRSSNRKIAAASGLSDEGQASKLLGRLERHGLIMNVGLGSGFGEPNAWLLTARGRHLAQVSRHDLKARASRGATLANGVARAT